MDSDVIAKIWIDKTNRICIQPKETNFENIYRSAMGVDWNSSERCLFPRSVASWSHAEWFKQIIVAVENEYGCKLYLATETDWTKIDDATRKDIELENRKIVSNV